MTRVFFLLSAGLICLSSCTFLRAPKKTSFTQNIETGQELSKRFKQSSEEGALIEQAVEELLKGELTVDEVLQIALLQNSKLQRTYTRYRLNQADLVQGGLLTSPLFVRRAENGNAPVAIEESEVLQNFLSVVNSQLEKKYKGLELQNAQISISSAVQELAAEVRSLYYHYQCRLLVKSMLEEFSQANQAAIDHAKRKLGGASHKELDLNYKESLCEQARLDLVQVQADSQLFKSKLNALMGLWDKNCYWSLEKGLPDVPIEEIPIEEVEALAFARRVDCSFLRKELDMADSESKELRELKEQFEDLSNEVRADLRQSYDRLIYARKKVEGYEKAILPLHRKMTTLVQRHYNFDLVGMDQLLAVKKDLIQAMKESAEALRDYWLVRSDLERLMETKLFVRSPIISVVEELS